MLKLKITEKYFFAYFLNKLRKSNFKRLEFNSNFYIFELKRADA